MQFKIVRNVAAALLLCLTLTACGSFSGYDDNAQIVKASSWSATGEVSFNTNTHLDMRCSKCNGVKSVATVTVPDDPTFDMTVNIEAGRFKVVLVQSNSVYLVTDTSTSGPVTTNGIPAGKYSVRLVAEDAKFQITLDLG